MDLIERTPAEGVEDESSDAQAKVPEVEEQTWSPNEDFVKSLLDMGVSRNAAERGLYFTGNTSAELAAEWVFDNIDHPELNNPFQIDHSLSGFTTLKSNLQTPYKMVFVVNDSLKMGVGKIAAQVAHAAIGLYKEVAEVKGHFAPMLVQWQEDGETKVVVRGESTQALMDLENQAMARRVPTYLVTDAGKTQVTPGAVTVLGLFGDRSVLDSITGQLKLL